MLSKRPLTLLLGAYVLTSSAHAIAQSYIPLYESSKGLKVFVESGSIERAGDVGKVTMLYDFPHVITEWGHQVMSQRAHVVFDCRRRLVATAAIDVYRQPHGAGPILQSEKVDQLQAAEMTTRDEEAGFNMVCGAK
jgi:hypothetical protein